MGKIHPVVAAAPRGSPASNTKMASAAHAHFVEDGATAQANIHRQHHDVTDGHRA